MSKVELDLKIQISEKTIKVIQAISKVSGRSTEEIKQEIVQKIESEFESSLVQKLLEELDIEGSIAAPTPAPQPRRVVAAAAVHQQRVETHDNQDTTGISEGLGDEDDEDPQVIGGEVDPEAAVTANGATDKELENEMEVENPKVEAKSAAVETSPDASAESTFSDILGLPPVPGEDERALKRKKQSKTRARISGMTAFPSDTE